MGEKSKIAWTDHTFNPWWGCVKVSPGCEHCYAESFSKRVGQDVWGTVANRRFFKDAHWDGPLKWNREAAGINQRARVFVASMADVCEDRPDLDTPRRRLMRVIEDTPALTWMLLTKRPQNYGRMFWERWPNNAWALTTAENQIEYEHRIGYLKRVKANVLGLSIEPMLGPIDMHDEPVNWVIVGGESGAGARPMQIEWARSIRDQCQDTKTAFFMKQLGGVRDHRDKMDDLPEDMRIREFPQGRGE